MSEDRRMYINFRTGMTFGDLARVVQEAKAAGAEDSWRVICGGLLKNRSAVAVHMIPAEKVFSVDYVEAERRVFEELKDPSTGPSPSPAWTPSPASKPPES